MIVYDVLWETLEKRGLDESYLKMGGLTDAQIERLRKNEYVSTRLIDRLCVMLNCRVDEVMRYIPGIPNQIIAK